LPLLEFEISSKGSTQPVVTHRVNSRRSGPHWLGRISDRRLVAVFILSGIAVVAGTILVVIPGLHGVSTILFVSGLVILAGAFLTVGLKRSAVPISLAMAVTVLIAAALALSPPSVPRWIVAAPAVGLVALLLRARGQLW
jgi:hypothetical protein